MSNRIARLLSESVMGFLALAALVFAVVPELFALTPLARTAAAAGEWLVIAAFALEYAAHWRLASDKAAFMRDPWRVLDLIVIMTPLVTLLPGFGAAARSTPALRLLRLLRALLVGTRARTRLHHREAVPPRPLPQGLGRASQRAPGPAGPAMLEWDAVASWFEQPRGWLHLDTLDGARLDELAQRTGLSRRYLDTALGDTAFPRLETIGAWSVLTLAMPQPPPRRRSEGLLVLASREALLTLSIYPSEVQSEVPPVAGEEGWALRAVQGLLRLLLSRHEAGAAAAERELRVLEEIPADESPHWFFSHSFALRRQLGLARADLMRLRSVLHSVGAGLKPLPGIHADARAAFERIAEECDALHETVDGARESLVSLLELHLNVSGYGVNRFMRLLAIVSTLALIPTVMGGLLGMNLATSPWPATLGQVGFGVLVMMLAVLYAFQAKGWLR